MIRGPQIAAICLISIVCAGCYDKVELNQLAVADIMAIDLADDGQLLVSLQFVIPGELSSLGGSGGAGAANRDAFYVIQAKGATLPEAFSFLQAKLPRRLFTSHVRVIVLGEAFAKAGIGPVFDSLTRMRELRVTMDVVLARGNAVELLRAAPRFEKLPATALATLLYQRVVPTRTVREVAISLVGDGLDLFLPTVGIAKRIEPERGDGQATSGADPPTSPGEFEITGVGIFRDDRLVGFTSREAARGLAWLLNRVPVSTTTLEWPPAGPPVERIPESQRAPQSDGLEQDQPPGTGPDSPGAGLNRPNQISPILLRGSSRIHSEVREGEIVIRVEAHAQDDILTNQAGLDLADPSVIPELEAAIGARVEERIRMILQLAQDVYQADIFGFGAMVRRDHPKMWREVRSDWNSVFSKLDVQVSVDIKVRRVGLTNRPASMKVEQLQK